MDYYGEGNLFHGIIDALYNRPMMHNATDLEGLRQQLSYFAHGVWLPAASASTRGALKECYGRMQTAYQTLVDQVAPPQSRFHSQHSGLLRATATLSGLMFLSWI